MSPARALSFSISVISLAVGVALAAPSGPDSPRAKFGRWLRAHGYPEVAAVVEPTEVTPLPGGEILPPLP
jgi:hypothetical protein